MRIDLESISGGKRNTNFNQKGNFKPISPEVYNYKGGPLNRLTDSEQKMFEYLNSIKKNNVNVSGKIDVVTELKFCDNCFWIIDLFQKKYPNIEITRIFIKRKIELFKKYNKYL